MKPAPRTGNRVAVALSVAALVTSVGLAGGPAIAKALNAQTVDHKSAVGAKATVKQRKGKLVATDKRTGRLPDNIIGTAPNALHAEVADSATKADNATELAGRPAAAYLTRAEAAEVVGTGSTPPDLPTAGVTTSGTTFTTSKPGRLLVDFTGAGQLQCASSNFVRWWIQVDGVPIASSSVRVGEAVAISFDYNGFPAIHLTGITTDVIEPGNHTVSLAGGCATGASGGSTSSGTAGSGVVTVLAPDAVGSPAARKAPARKSCLSSGECR
jgi:hypothetical protein